MEALHEKYKPHHLFSVSLSIALIKFSLSKQTDRIHQPSPPPPRTPRIRQVRDPLLRSTGVQGPARTSPRGPGRSTLLPTLLPPLAIPVKPLFRLYVPRQAIQGKLGYSCREYDPVHRHLLACLSGIGGSKVIGRYGPWV